ncbi:MAG TPA: hypothetical protein VI818_00195, partial [Candidatus Thermoplasmatota archaeon]|nr:hypothetical protein [Candidatus Thermoplasmatota archaeon]
MVGIVGALLAGAAELVAESVIADAGGNEPMTSVAVPAGRVGDQVAYSSYERSGEATAWTPRRGWEFKLDSLGVLPDRTGVLHDAINYVFNASTPGRSFIMNTPIDLATRDTLGFREEILRVESGAAPVQADQAGHAFYGPYPAPKGLYTAPRYLAVTETLFQGNTYEVGTDATKTAERLLAGDYDYNVKDVFLGEAGVTASGVNVHGDILPAVRVGDHSALGLRAKGCMALDREEGGSQQADVLGVEVPVPSDVCFERIEFLTATLPYPVRRETTLLVNGTES